MYMITGNRQHSSDLPQGGLELPCTYTFSGPEHTMKKVKHRLIEDERWAFRIAVRTMLICQAACTQPLVLMSD